MERDVRQRTQGSQMNQSKNLKWNVVCSKLKSYLFFMCHCELPDINKMSIQTTSTVLDLRSATNIFYNTNEIVDINVRRSRAARPERFFVAYSYLFSIDDVPFQLRTFYRQEQEGLWVPYIMIDIGTILDDETIQFYDVVVLRDSKQEWWHIHEYLETKRQAQGAPRIRLTPQMQAVLAASQGAISAPMAREIAAETDDSLQTANPSPAVTEPVTINTPNATVTIEPENPATLDVDESLPVGMQVQDSLRPLELSGSAYGGGPTLIKPRKSMKFSTRIQTYYWNQPRARLVELFEHDLERDGPLGPIVSKLQRNINDKKFIRAYRKKAEFKKAYELMTDFYIKDAVLYDLQIAKLLYNNSILNLTLNGNRYELTPNEISYLEREQTENKKLFDKFVKIFVDLFNLKQPYKTKIRPTNALMYKYRKIFPSVAVVQGGVITRSGFNTVTGRRLPPSRTRFFQFKERATGDATSGTATGASASAASGATGAQPSRNIQTIKESIRSRVSETFEYLKTLKPLLEKAGQKAAEFSNTIVDELVNFVTPEMAGPGSPPKDQVRNIDVKPNILNYEVTRQDDTLELKVFFQTSLDVRTKYYVKLLGSNEYPVKASDAIAKISRISSESPIILTTRTLFPYMAIQVVAKNKFEQDVEMSDLLQITTSVSGRLQPETPEPFPFGIFSLGPVTLWMNLSYADAIKNNYADKKMPKNIKHSYSFRLGDTKCSIVDRSIGEKQSQVQFLLEKRPIMTFETFSEDLKPLLSYFKSQDSIRASVEDELVDSKLVTRAFVKKDPLSLFADLAPRNEEATTQGTVVLASPRVSSDSPVVFGFDSKNQRVPIRAKREKLVYPTSKQ